MRRLIEAFVAASVIIAVVLGAASIHPIRISGGQYAGRRTLDIRTGLFVSPHADRLNTEDLDGVPAAPCPTSFIPPNHADTE